MDFRGDKDYKRRWISVSDRLPEPGALVYYRTRTFRYFGSLNTDGRWFDRNGKPETSEVIEWMPIELE